MKLNREHPLRTGRLKLPLGTLFWHELGEPQGETLIFLHGSWQEGTQWLPLMASLGSDFHCLAPDLLGFGESSSATVPNSIALQVESLETFLKALRISRCYLIGHSLGAWVATQFALSHPQVVQGLVVIAPEGIEFPGLERRWHRYRWLSQPFSLPYWGLRLISPLVKQLGGKVWLQHTFALRRQLLQFPAACRLLFRRRSSELKSELLSAQPLPTANIPMALFVATEASETIELLNAGFLKTFPEATQDRVTSAETPWGLAEQETIMALTRFFQSRFPVASSWSSFHPGLHEGQDG